MSGNTTRLAVGVAGIPAEALVAGRLILAFLGGVILGSLIGRLGGWKRQPMILMLVALMIALGALAGMWGAPSIATLLVAAAMGAENTTFERDGEVSIGLTYMTGTLVKLGQRIARALTGGRRWTGFPMRRCGWGWPLARSPARCCGRISGWAGCGWRRRGRWRWRAVRWSSRAATAVSHQVRAYRRRCIAARLRSAARCSVPSA
jgi:hypothetical protein